MLAVARARLLRGRRGDQGRSLDLPGLVTLACAVSAFVLPLVLGQSERRSARGWACLATLQLRSGFGDSPLRAGLTFAPAATTRGGSA